MMHMSPEFMQKLDVAIYGLITAQGYRENSFGQRLSDLRRKIRERKVLTKKERLWVTWVEMNVK